MAQMPFREIFIVCGNLTKYRQQNKGDICLFCSFQDILANTGLGNIAKEMSTNKGKLSFDVCKIYLFVKASCSCKRFFYRIYKEIMIFGLISTKMQCHCC